MIKKFLALAFIIMSLNLFGQVDEEYSKTLKKMFEVSSSEQSFQTVIKQMFTMFR